MTTCAVWQTRFDEADQALHTLLTGGKVQKLKHGEKELTYSPANVGELRQYVAYLQAKIDGCNGTTRYNRRILRIIPLG